MDQFIRTYENLAYCFRKIHFENEYLKASEEDRSQMCSNEKSRFLEALNSDEMRFSNFIKLRLNNVQSKYISKD